MFDLLGSLRSTTKKTKQKNPAWMLTTGALTYSFLRCCRLLRAPRGIALICVCFTFLVKQNPPKKQKNRRSNCAATKLSDTLAAGLCSPPKSSAILRCSVDARVSQVGTRYSLVVWGFSFSCTRQTVYCTECLHMIPKLN